MRLIYGDIDGNLNKGITGHGQGVSFIKQIAPAATILNYLYQGVPEEYK